MKQFRFGQSGFTLIEILIAVGILALLAGIAVPTVAVLLSQSKDKAEEGEWSNVQTAIDSMMANKESESITEVNNPTNDMTNFPPGSPLYPDYLRTDRTRCFYTVEFNGRVPTPGLSDCPP